MSHPLFHFNIGGVNLDHIGNWQWWTGVLIAVIIAGFTGFGVGYIKMAAGQYRLGKETSKRIFCGRGNSSSPGSILL